MLSDKDIKKLIEIFATRDEVATKKSLEILRKDFLSLQSSVNTYIKKTNNYF